MKKILIVSPFYNGLFRYTRPLYEQLLNSYVNNKVKFDRKKFIDKIINLDFPDKKNILKYFYGVEVNK